MKKVITLFLALVMILSVVALSGCESAEVESATSFARRRLSTEAYSRTGLIDALVTDGFKPKVAAKAVDELKVDWQKQALAYYEANVFHWLLLTGEETVQRLMGAGFTRAEAEYAYNYYFGENASGSQFYNP